MVRAGLVRSRARPRAGLLSPDRPSVGACVPGRWAHRPPRSSGGWGNLRGSTADSAIGSDLPATDGRLMPVVPLSVPELRRILAFHWHLDPVSPAFFWQWSTWQRYTQALAMRSHYQKREAAPPDFAYMRL